MSDGYPPTLHIGYPGTPDYARPTEAPAGTFKVPPPPGVPLPSGQPSEGERIIALLEAQVMWLERLTAAVEKVLHEVEDDVRPPDTQRPAQ